MRSIASAKWTQDCGPSGNNATTNALFCIKDIAAWPASSTDARHKKHIVRKLIREAVVDLDDITAEIVSPQRVGGPSIADAVTHLTIGRLSEKNTAVQSLNYTSSSRLPNVKISR
jgi:hypothetical protein